MRHEGANITGARHRGHVISAIYHYGKLVWQSASAVFSRGWNNDLGWQDDEGWNND